MKTLICSVFVSLLFSASSAISQNSRTFYDVCESNEQTYVDFQRERIVVNRLTNDSLVFVSDGITYTAPTATGTYRIAVFAEASLGAGSEYGIGGACGAGSGTGWWGSPFTLAKLLVTLVTLVTALESLVFLSPVWSCPTGDTGDIPGGM